MKKVYSKGEKRLGKLNPNFSSEMKSLAFLLPSVDSGIENEKEKRNESQKMKEGGKEGEGRKEEVPPFLPHPLPAL